MRRSAAAAGGRYQRSTWVEAIIGLLQCTVPMLACVAPILLVISAFQSFGSCDFNLNVSVPDRTDCSGSTDPLVRDSVAPGGSKVTADLARGDHVNEADGDGNRALPCAAMVGNLAAVDRLLAAGANANESGYAGGRPIVAAVSGEGRDGNSLEDDSHVTFHAVLSPDRTTIVTDLLDHGAVADDALAPAAEKDNAAVVAVLLRRGANPDGEAGEPSPLLSAAIGDNPDIVHMLLAAGADPNRGGKIAGTAAADALTFDPVPPETPMLTPAILGQVGMLQNVGNVPPLVAAALTGDSTAAGVGLLLDLIAHGANVNALAFGRFSALWVAAATENVTDVLVLRAHGALDIPPGGLSAPGAALVNHDAPMLALLGS